MGAYDCDCINNLEYDRRERKQKEQPQSTAGQLNDGARSTAQSTDLIDRQAAIEALKNRWKKTRNYEGNGDDIAEECELYLKQVPSAQPEVIRCKDCKYWMPHSQLGYDEDNETYHDYCKNLIPEDEYYAFYRCADDYCSKAERRTDE